MQLRPYQVKMLDDSRDLMHQGIKSILLQSPTGSGKTILMAHMAKTAEAQGMRTWFIVHRRELIRQSIHAFEALGVKIGVVATGWPMLQEANTQICSIQLLTRRYKWFKRPTLIAWDECHHNSATSYKKIYDAFPEAFHVGLTATPERLDGQGLGQFFQKMVSGPSVSSLIDQGYLSPYRLYAPSTIDLSKVRTVMGDYNKKDLQAASDKPTITGDAINEYKKLADGKRAIVFCTGIQHSENVVYNFNAAGIKAKHIDGKTPIPQRDKAIKEFADGEIKVLSNVELVGEGFDLPSIECAILLRPTQSTALYLQQVGRSLRPSPGKECSIILDHAGNCERHGLPDEERIWDLAGRNRNKRVSASGIRIKICPKCYAAQSNADCCKFCGFVYVVGSNAPVASPGELSEVNIAEIRKRRAWEQARTSTYEQLVELGKSRGYPRPELWAKYVFESRQRKSAARGT